MHSNWFIIVVKNPARQYTLAAGLVKDRESASDRRRVITDIGLWPVIGGEVNQ